MAINVQLDVKVSGFQSAIVSRVDNRITVGGRVGTGHGVDTSDLSSSLPATPAPMLAMREDGDLSLRRAPGAVPSPQAPYRPEGAKPASRAPGAAAPSPAPVHPSTPRAALAETDAAIRDAAKVAGVDVNTMRGIASIESDMNAGSNRNRRTQYKGLYQLNRAEFGRNGSGNIYNAHDNAMAAGRMFAADKANFRKHFDRDPTDRELYMMHQQGLGFYTRGAMTNIRGNSYPGMHGPQTHQSFEAGWGRELERRARGFAERERAAAATPEKK